jgi:tetratricopeptide (TPR) repeat protein
VFLKEGREFRYDVYRVPWNGGGGGRAEPLRGASGNGRSNYFPKYSPDGRWIVFCQAANYMLLQPDSELFIIPAEGGEARRLGCNLGRMNSWHSWSMDGKWMVFSSKAHSIYTQLYLTRISEAGEASPPVWLDYMVGEGRAANIPEFVALAPDAITRIRPEFLDDYSYVRVGNSFFRAGEVEPALENYGRALALNPNNAMAHQRVGFLLLHRQDTERALGHLREAVRLEPENGFARYDLGRALMLRGDPTNAARHFAEAVRLLPTGYDRLYNAVGMNYALGEAYYGMSAYDRAIPVLQAVLRLEADHARANYMLAMALSWTGETDATAACYERAIRSDPKLGRLPDYHDLQSRNLMKEGRWAEARDAAEAGARLARAAGRSEQAAKLEKRAAECRR